MPTGSAFPKSTELTELARLCDKGVAIDEIAQRFGIPGTPYLFPQKSLDG